MGAAIFHQSQSGNREMILTSLSLVSRPPLPVAYVQSCAFICRAAASRLFVTLTIALGTCMPTVSHLQPPTTSSLLFSAFFMIFFLKEGTGQKKCICSSLVCCGLGVISEFPSALIVLLWSPIIFRYQKEIKTTASSARSSLPLLGG